jgi:hypothetical protein
MSWRNPPSGSNCRATALAVTVLALMTLVGSHVAYATPNATIIATPFTDVCRDVSLLSSKDISFVEIHYADGRVIKDERIDNPYHAIDGSAGDEIEFVTVKSGVTRRTFPCTTPNSPPRAILEIEAPPDCVEVSSLVWSCNGMIPRTAWLDPADGAEVGFFCVGTMSGCDFNVVFRGTSSSDPDNDIVSWSIVFGDGTSVSGDWTTDPPTGLSATVDLDGLLTATLTVTDSTGQSDSATMVVGFACFGCD